MEGVQSYLQWPVFQIKHQHLIPHVKSVGLVQNENLQLNCVFMDTVGYVEWSGVEWRGT